MSAAVAFNALALAPGGAGPSTYIRELLAELVAIVDGRLVAAVGTDAVGELPAGVTAVPRRAASGLRRNLQGLRMPADALVIHGLDVDLPRRTPVPTVSTVHDLAVFDVPWAFPRRRIAAKRLLVAQAVRRADVLVAVSEFTAERLQALFRRDAVVIPEAPSGRLTPASPEDVRQIRRTYDLPDQFVLHVGTLEPRKNVSRLAEACRRIDVPFVAVGASGWLTSPPLGVIVPGFVPPADLPAFYGAATLTAYASVYEGFGFPPVEAMACGSPVVSTPVPSVKLLGTVPVIAPSGTVDDLMAAMSGLLRDEDQRAERSARGLEAVKSLRWDEAARATASIYERLGVPVRLGIPAPSPIGSSSGRPIPPGRGTWLRSLAARELVEDPRRTGS